MFIDLQDLFRNIKISLSRKSKLGLLNQMVKFMQVKI